MLNRNMPLIDALAEARKQQTLLGCRRKVAKLEQGNGGRRVRFQV